MKKLEKPLLYLILYLLGNRVVYVQRLMDMRSKGDWLGWIKFMLLGIELTAKEAISVSESLGKLQGEMSELVSGQQRGKDLLRLLYQYPIINAQGVRKHLGI